MDEQESNEVGVKRLSKWVMVVASIWVSVGSVLKWVGVFKNLEFKEILMSGAVLVGLWAPTYVSMWIDKLIELKRGPKC